MDGHVRMDALPLTPEPTQHCKDCAKDKPVSEFPRNKAMPTGRGFYCRPCHSARSQAWKRENPEAVAQARARRKKIKELLAPAPWE